MKKSEVQAGMLAATRVGPVLVLVEVVEPYSEKLWTVRRIDTSRMLKRSPRELRVPPKSRGQIRS